MASNRSDSSELDGSSYDPPFVPAYIPPYEPEAAPGAFAAPAQSSATGEWAPGEDHPAAPVRGRHRVVKPRGGTMARSGAVLGAGMIAAVGAGGMASAQDRPQAPISMPDLAQSIPVVGSLMADGHGQGARQSAEAQQAPVETVRTVRDTADAGEVLRARILQQAEHQQMAAEAEAQARVAQAAAEQHRKAAAEKAAAEREAAERQAADAKAATYEAAQRAAREAAGGGVATDGSAADGSATDGSAGVQERHATGTEASSGASGSAHRAAGGTFTLPVASYTLTAGFGQAGNMWSANHTGEDFAAPTGTPVKAVGGGTVTQAGWAGAYGYRVVLTLDDGTEVWYCHLSSMVVTSGKVGTGTVIGRVGATGNVTGPHLHLEVRPGGGAPVDPLSWLRGRGLEP
ncbi:M23 family metallopeptidase [Streptomyces abikoensis]|uniref:M23 family metallopeptidase n=1 Tax=Streptomyces abikoensis TaxID=97398 RepID=UPI00341056E9